MATGLSKPPLTGLTVYLLELAEAGRGKIAGDAAHAKAVGPVRRNGDVEHRIVEAEQLRRRAANSCFGRKLDNAGMLVGQFELPLRQHHAARFDAADLGLGQGEVDAGHVSADGREHAFEPSARVRRAAHDLQALLAGIDLQDLELVGVGMLLGFHHLCHAEVLERSGGVEHLLDLEPDAGQRLGDLVNGGFRVEMLFQPCERELHG